MTVIIKEKINDVKSSLFSIAFFIVGPKYLISNATIKNLDPLVRAETIMK